MKGYYKITDEYRLEGFLEHPVFEYLYMLKKAKIITPKEYYDWNYILQKQLTIIETDVSLGDVVDYMRKYFFSEGTTYERALELVKQSSFNYEKVVENVKVSRVMNNAQAAAERIRKTMISVLEDLMYWGI